MSFPISELQLHNDSPEEQERVRIIFDNLKAKAINQETLTEHEKDFFCTLVKISKLNDGSWDNYSCCNNFKFKQLCLTYLLDLTGGSNYYKPKGIGKRLVEINEAQQDLKYLYEEADKWDLIVQKENHTEQLLLQVSIEARSELKNLDKQPEFANNPYAKGTFRYRFKRMGILLWSKYNYCAALEIFETFNPYDLILEINSTQIEFNEYSLIHILNRHFGKIMKQYDTQKTFHHFDIKPRILSPQIKQILKEIDDTQLFSGCSIDKIAFQLNGTDYIIWTSERTKPVKGKGNVPFRRLDTFYPVSDESEKSKLTVDYNLVRISDSLSVYIPH